MHFVARSSQLAALATLHLALKSGGNAVRLQDLVALSRGYFSSEQVIYTESKGKTYCYYCEQNLRT